MTTRILLSVSHMGGREQAYVAEAFATNWLSTVGPNINAFEDEFGRHIGMPSVALSSGTAAMHLDLRQLGAGPGDELFCPTLTFVATANRSIGHDSVTGEGTTVSSHCDIMGYVSKGRERFLGSHACILPGKRVGEFARVGAASAVVRNVASGSTVVGVPAQVLLEPAESKKPASTP